MRSTPLAEARAEFSKLIDLALSGEPQRVTRRGREAVVIASETEWAERGIRADEEVSPSLGHLIADYADRVGFRDEDFVRTWKNTRTLDLDPPD